MKQVKGHGFIRKNKAGKVVSGIVLGTAMLMAGHVASADEVKPTEVKNITELLSSPDGSKATKGNEDNNVTANSKEAENSPEQAKVDGQLNKIVSDAKAKGVDVAFEGEAKVTPEQADEAVKKVEEKVNKVVEEHSKEVEAYNKKVAEVKAENAKIQKENQAIENSNKNAKAVLTKDSTAKEVNGVYTQTLKGVSKTEKSANLTGSSKGTVSITTGAGVKLISADLLSPSGKKQALEVKDNKVAYNGVLSEKGEYKVNYSFTSSANQKDQIVGNFTIDSDIQDITTKDKKVNAPMDLIAMVDESPSNESRSSEIFPILKKMMADANPKSRMAFYGTTVNEINSHIIRKGSATRWLSMEEANKFIDIVIKAIEKERSEGWPYEYSSRRFTDAIKNNPQFAVEEKYYNKEIEQAHKDLPNKNKIFNIIQVTDGWSKNEKMDSSFAEYAKANAKTFVSVINAPASADYATGQMKLYGLNNVVNLNPVSDIDKIVAYFKQVAVETEVIKGTPKKESGKDGKTDKFEPTSAKAGKSLLPEPKAPANAKVAVEAIKVEKPEAPKPVEEKPTPKPIEKKPEAPKPIEKKPETPKPQEPKKVLPQTGETASMALVLAGIGGLMFAGASFKKKEN